MSKSEKTKLTRSRKSLILRLGKYLARQKGLLLVAFLLMTFSNILALVGPALSGYAVDAITKKGGVDFNGVFVNCTLMIFVYCLI